MKDIEIYTVGIVCMSVCAKKYISITKIEKEANLLYPTGMESKWEKSEDKTFKGGEPMPCVCESDETRQHWLLNC